MPSLYDKGDKVVGTYTGNIYVIDYITNQGEGDLPQLHGHYADNVDHEMWVWEGDIHPL